MSVTAIRAPFRHARIRRTATAGTTAAHTATTAPTATTAVRTATTAVHRVHAAAAATDKRRTGLMGMFHQARSFIYAITAHIGTVYNIVPYLYD